jgi:hypothetical protein
MPVPADLPSVPLEPPHVAQRRTCLPVGPDSLTGHGAGVDGRQSRRLPTELSGESYLNQSYVLTYQGLRVLLEPATAPNSDEPDDPLYLVSGWHPWGQASTYPACRVDQASLRRSATQVGTITGTAVACAADKTWFEHALLVAGLSDAQAVDLARRAGQLAAIRWHRGYVTVLPTGPLVCDPRTVPVLLRPAPATCPLRDDERPSLQCLEWGGHGASAAMFAAVLFRSYRQLALDLLGCEPCAGGRTHHSIPPSSKPWEDGPVVASRHGGTCADGRNTRSRADALARPPKGLR